MEERPRVISAVGPCFVYSPFLPFPFLPDFLDANAKLPIKDGGIVQYGYEPATHPLIRSSFRKA